MQKQKAAFTMVELIFVIVILGILAAVAVPKLAATRDDAKMSRTAHNIMVGAGEIAAYAVAQGVTDTDFTIMSNAMQLLQNSGEAVLTSSKADIAFGNVNDCVSVEVVSGVNDENLTISFGSAGTDTLCLALQNLIDAQQYPMQLRGSLVVH
ncbi:MAG: type II secretion system protein [Sulfurimonas sp.]|nr:type II secretion system protein [Sulfurimonas sp.]